MKYNTDTILIFGDGFIGRRLHGHYNCFISDKRISNITDIIEEIEKYNATIIINCIGYTGGANVDGCELEVNRTLTSNSLIPLMFAEAAIRTEVKLVHISSGCIYNYFEQPLLEEDPPDFFDLYYSRTKIYAERALSALSDKYGILIARIRIPLDFIPHERNLLTKLLTFTQVIDSPNSVTYIPDFMGALSHLIKIDASGIYNLTNSGGLRYPDLLAVYNRYHPHLFSTISSCEDIGKVRTNLLLSTHKLESTGFKIRDINSILVECVNKYLDAEKGNIQ